MKVNLKKLKRIRKKLINYICQEQRCSSKPKENQNIPLELSGAAGAAAAITAL